MWLWAETSGIRITTFFMLSGDQVSKKLECDFGIELLFDTAFGSANEAEIGFGQISLKSDQTDASKTTLSVYL